MPENDAVLGIIIFGNAAGLVRKYPPGKTTLTIDRTKPAILSIQSFPDILSKARNLFRGNTETSIDSGYMILSSIEAFLSSIEIFNGRRKDLTGRRKDFIYQF